MKAPNKPMETDVRCAPAAHWQAVTVMLVIETRPHIGSTAPSARAEERSNGRS